MNICLHLSLGIAILLQHILNNLREELATVNAVKDREQERTAIIEADNKDLHNKVIRLEQEVQCHYFHSSNLAFIKSGRAMCPFYTSQELSLRSSKGLGCCLARSCNHRELACAHAYGMQVEGLNLIAPYNRWYCSVLHDSLHLKSDVQLLVADDKIKAVHDTVDEEQAVTRGVLKEAQQRGVLIDELKRDLAAAAAEAEVHQHDYAE